jgi:hypothetical protein
MTSNKKSDNSQEAANASTKPKIESIEDLLQGLDQEGEDDSNQQPLKKISEGEENVWGDYQGDWNSELHKSMYELHVAYDKITIDGDLMDQMEQFHRSWT